MSNKNGQLIWVSKRNKEILKNAGTITDSFDSVITRLIESTGLDKKVALARGVLADSSTESKARGLQSPPFVDKGGNGTKD
jgi:hypothetical protein